MSVETGVAGPAGPAGLAEQMRTAFDAGFARSRESDGVELVDLLEVRVGDRRLELPVGEIARVVAGPVITPVPARVPALRGVAGVDDALVAVYDLGVLLDLPPAAPSWLLTAAAEPGAGVAFDAVLAHRRVPAAQPRSLPRLSMPDLVARIRNLAHPDRSQR